MFNYKIIISSMVILLSTLNNTVDASSEHAEQPATANEQTAYLDLSYVLAGDYSQGTLYNEEELIQILTSNPNVIELNLSGQFSLPSLMYIIHDNLTQLKQLTLKGSIRNSDGDGELYSWESVNPQEIMAEDLQALFQNESPIEMLDLSLSTVDDNGLIQIATGATNLREIYLRGACQITDVGITFLVENAPTLKLIDLRDVVLKQPQGTQEVQSMQISEELIADLTNRGIIIRR